MVNMREFTMRMLRAEAGEKCVLNSCRQGLPIHALNGPLIKASCFSYGKRAAHNFFSALEHQSRPAPENIAAR